MHCRGAINQSNPRAVPQAADPIRATELQAAIDRAALDISVVYSPPFWSVPGKFPECWLVTYWGRSLHSSLLDNTQRCDDPASARTTYLAMCDELLSRSSPAPSHDASPGLRHSAAGAA